MENKELGRLVLRQVTEFPESFDMGDWAGSNACGTTACIAGWAMFFSGYEVNRYSCFIRPDGSMVTDDEAEGRGLLGLSQEELYVSDEDDGLFYIDKDEAIRRLAELAAG